MEAAHFSLQPMHALNGLQGVHIFYCLERLMSSQYIIMEGKFQPEPDLGRILLYVKDTPFEFGTLPVIPCPKLSLGVLQRIVDYCRVKGYTRSMNLGNWYHMCKYKLKLKYELGWTYIRLYDVIFQQTSEMRRMGLEEDAGYWDDRCHTLRCKKYDRKNEFEVSTLKFLLFLFIQHSYRLINKIDASFFDDSVEDDDNSLFQPDIEFEEDSEEDEFDETTIEREEKRIIDEQQQFKFVYAYLTVIIRFLETGEYDSPRLKMDVVEALELILCAAESTAETEFYPLTDLIVRSKIADFDDSSNTVDRTLFILWVRRSLILNPWGSTRGLYNLPLEEVITGVADEILNVHSRRENRIMCNFLPEPICWNIISNVKNQVVYLDNLKEYSSVRLYKCSRAFIYVVGALTSVSIEWCTDCTVFFGCISSVARFTSCRNVVFVGVVRQLIVSGTVVSAFHIHTPCPPLLAGDGNSQLLFGPYTSYYPLLQHEMFLTKFGNELSHWNNILGLAFQGHIVNCDEQWSKTEGRMIFQFIFPFKLIGPTICNPINLQARHNWVIDKKQRNVQRWTYYASLEKNYKLKKSEARTFLGILYARFIKHLIQSGLEDEILALCSYNKANNPDLIRQNSFLAAGGDARHLKEGDTKILFERHKPQSLEDVLRILTSIAKYQTRTNIFARREEHKEDSKTP